MQLRQQSPRVINTNRRKPQPVIPPVVQTPVEEDKEIIEEVIESTQDTQRKPKQFKVGFNKNEKNKTSNN